MFGDPEGGCDLGVGEQLDHIARESSKVPVFESEGATLISGGELAASEAYLVQLRYFSYLACVGQDQVVPRHC